MLRSTQRILTTHTGSLPRPEDLTRLYIDRGQGKHVDSEELAGAGRQATRASIRSQADAGIAIGNNGEQPRDSFFLYLRDRLTGLGGSLGAAYSRRRRALSGLQEALGTAGLGRRQSLERLRRTDGHRRGLLRRQ